MSYANLVQQIYLEKLSVQCSLCTINLRYTIHCIEHIPYHKYTLNFSLCNAQFIT